MTGFKESFVKLCEHESPHNVKLGDDYQYPIKGSGESSYKLDSEKSMKMKNVLFVPGQKKSLLSTTILDAKGMRVSFVYGQVLMCPKGNIFNDAIVIGKQEGDLYKLKGQPKQSLVHDSVEPNELWHIRLAYVHYRALPLASKAVEGLPEIQAKHDGFCKGCAKGRTQRRHFQVVRARKKEPWKSSTSMYAFHFHPVH